MEKEIRKLLEGLGIDKKILSVKAIKKMALVFEAKVNQKVSVKEQELEESNTKVLDSFKDEMVEKLDEYMNYFAENYIEENKDDITDAVTVKTAKRVLENFNGMVSEFHLSLDEDQVDQSEEINNLKEQLNSSVNKALLIESKLEKSVKKQLISEVAGDIEVESERDSYVAIAENFDFEDVDGFKEKLTFLKENINTSTTEDIETLEESEIDAAQDNVLEESSDNSNDPMKKYLKVYARN